jgi:hypothetical protein
LAVVRAAGATAFEVILAAVADSVETAAEGASLPLEVTKLPALKQIRSIGITV